MTVDIGQLLGAAAGVVVKSNKVTSVLVFIVQATPEGR
jgi:hypothetical protein